MDLGVEFDPNPHRGALYRLKCAGLAVGQPPEALWGAASRPPCLGAIGGFVAAGMIGLFVGVVILVRAYELLTVWLDAADGEVAGTAESG